MKGFLGAILILMSVAAAHAEWQPTLVDVPKGQLLPFWSRPAQNGAAPERIEVQGFHAMTAPVTNAEYREFLRLNPEWSKSRVKRIFADSGYLESNKTAPASAPVTSISWFAARAFCERYNMRLPTVVEWEYMGTASETSPDAGRDPKFLQTILDWYSEPRTGRALPSVRRSRPNYYGVYDMHSLIWEWVEDFNSNLQSGEGRGDGSVNKDLFCGGGGVSGNKEDYASYMRFAFRSSLKGASTVWNLGFRCVKDLEK